MVFLSFSYVTITSSNPCLEPVSTINIKTPPHSSCNIVFNLNAPLGDKNPNQTISARLSSLFSDDGVKTFINCEPFQS